LTSLIFHFAKGFLAKKVLMTAQKDFRLGNSLCRIGPKKGSGLYLGLKKNLFVWVEV